MQPTHAQTLSVVIGAYQAESWIGEALDAVLGQSRPPDEVVVVDDGSTDGTAAILAAYGDRIRVFRQPNAGCPAAFNRAIREARGDWVALCGADDVWEPRKLEWQLEAIGAHPEVGVLFGHAVMFGLLEHEHERPPGTGVLEPEAFATALFAVNCVCAPSVVVRRALFAELGPFIEDYGTDDYEYWFRCLRAGVRFYYDPRPLLRWRQHGANLSWKTAWMDECSCLLLREYERDVADRAVVADRLAPLLFRIARRHVDAGRPAEARAAFREALRYHRGTTTAQNVRAAAWVCVLGLPEAPRQRAERAFVRLSRALAREGARSGVAVP